MQVLSTAVSNENQVHSSVDLQRDKQAILSSEISECMIRPWIENEFFQ